MFDMSDAEISAEARRNYAQARKFNGAAITRNEFTARGHEIETVCASCHGQGFHPLDGALHGIWSCNRCDGHGSTLWIGGKIAMR